MALAPGTRLGVYEVVGLIGSGGMGEVYRARDSRLGREVAIKVLPADLVSDADRLARFEREARTVSALNHPHIVTLHEVGTSDFGPYLVLERIEGSSLRTLLASGPLPVRSLLNIGTQVAEGLASAHSAGIVHRDLKPENVMVNKDGLVKILDFGLAKLAESDEAERPTEAAGVGGRTIAGVILGTPGYLSPEQASGRTATFSSDQFALGTLLYEMATGVSPFRRQNRADAMMAVIRDEPASLRERRPDAPPQLEWIVDRCLAKDPQDRYASTRDLARDLRDLRDHLSQVSRGEPTVVAAATTSRHRWRGVALALVPTLLAVGAMAGFHFLTTRAADPPPSYRPLTFRAGVITGARFSADGKAVYYSAAYGADPSRVYMTRLDAVQSELLDLPPAMLLAVSRQGELAILLTGERNIANSMGTLARVPSLGGTPRLIAENVVDADWAPDGQRLLIRRSDDHLEFPIGGRVIGAEAIWPRLSPSGDRIAWEDDTSLRVSDLNGKTLLAHEVPFTFGLAWRPDGGEIWYSGSESGSGYDRALYALSLDGRQRLLARAPGALTILDVATDGKSALVSTGAGWLGVNFVRPGAAAERSLDLLGRTLFSGLSVDGRWIVEWEYREVGSGAYLRSTDGTKTIRLGDDPPIGISPDGAWVLAFRQTNHSRLVLLPTGPGTSREIALDPELQAEPGSYAVWSRDGTRVFLALHRKSAPHRWRIYMREADKPFRPVTPEGVENVCAVSPDGRAVAVPDATGSLALFPTDGGTPQRFNGDWGAPIMWSADGAWIFLQKSGFPARVQRLNVRDGRVESWKNIAPADPSGVIGVARVFIAGDGETYAYGYSRIRNNELYLAQGLR